jgi:hypothetical protein
VASSISLQMKWSIFAERRFPSQTTRCDINCMFAHSDTCLVFPSTLPGITRLVVSTQAFCFIPRKNPFRVLIAYIAKHSLFDTFILCCIFVSSISLIIEKPEDSIMATEDQCPSLGLDCRNLQPGHTFYVNCPRSVSDDGWNTFFGACGTPEENGCCATKAMLNAFSIMDQVWQLR